ncbi:hypothetical protein ACFYUY_31170 [Kitasatospora sp. NPDC004745]|uniref:hypothetical protein n=1 Tax=Kitasatospora sp. NPDC004745 TaxID=3364019 RepID=UPI0036874B07
MVGDSARLSADASKALRVMRALDSEAPWIKFFRNEAPLYRVPLTVAEGADTTLRMLRDDLFDFLDEKVSVAHQEAVDALSALCEEMTNHLFQDRTAASYLVIPPEWKDRDPDRYYLAARQLGARRTTFLEVYRRLANVLNANGLLSQPRQVADVAVQYILNNFDGYAAQGQTVSQQSPVGDLSALLKSEDFQSGLAERIASSLTAGTNPRSEIGRGSERRLEFEAAAAQLPGGSAAWQASADVELQGPGVLQRLVGSSPGPGWILCAGADRPVLGVPEAVWAALHRIGSLNCADDPFGAIGFPVTSAGAAVIDEAATEVKLAGGRSAGRIVRLSPESTSWRWEPEPRISFEKPRASSHWADFPTAPHLQLRVVADVPWIGAQHFDISSDARGQLEQVLPFSRLAGAVTVLSSRRGRELRAGVWQRCPDWNSSRSAAYMCSLSGEGGPSGLSSRMMITLPYPGVMDVIACAELQVGDPQAWGEGLGLPSAAADQARMSPEELLEFFVAGWATVTELLLPAAASVPADVPLRGAPQIGLIVTATQPSEPVASRWLLRDVLDLASLGHSGSRIEHLTEMFISVEVPLDLTDSERRSLARDAMVEMFRAYGFIDVSATSF